MQNLKEKQNLPPSSTPFTASTTAGAISTNTSAIKLADLLSYLREAFMLLKSEETETALIQVQEKFYLMKQELKLNFSVVDYKKFFEIKNNQSETKELLQMKDLALGISEWIDKWLDKLNFFLNRYTSRTRGVDGEAYSNELKTIKKRQDNLETLKNFLREPLISSLLPSENYDILEAKLLMLQEDFSELQQKQTSPPEIYSEFCEPFSFSIRNFDTESKLWYDVQEKTWHETLYTSIVKPEPFSPTFADNYSAAPSFSSFSQPDSILSSVPLEDNLILFELNNILNHFQKILPLLEKGEKEEKIQYLGALEKFASMSSESTQKLSTTADYQKFFKTANNTIGRNLVLKISELAEGIANWMDAQLKFCDETEPSLLSNTIEKNQKKAAKFLQILEKPVMKALMASLEDYDLLKSRFELFVTGFSPQLRLIERNKQSLTSESSSSSSTYSSWSAMEITNEQDDQSLISLNLDNIHQHIQKVFSLLKDNEIDTNLGSKILDEFDSMKNKIFATTAPYKKLFEIAADQRGEITQYHLIFTLQKEILILIERQAEEIQKFISILDQHQSSPIELSMVLKNQEKVTLFLQILNQPVMEAASFPEKSYGFLKAKLLIFAQDLSRQVELKTKPILSDLNIIEETFIQIGEDFKKPEPKNEIPLEFKYVSNLAVAIYLEIKPDKSKQENPGYKFFMNYLGSIAEPARVEAMKIKNQIKVARGLTSTQYLNSFSLWSDSGPADSPLTLVQLIEKFNNPTKK